LKTIKLISAAYHLLNWLLLNVHSGV
jgi:hypothetical protein